MKTVLITGANRGIGLALAKVFKNDGWNVIGTARNPSKASELGEVASSILQLDVSKPESINNAFGDGKIQQIDLLINNAGVYHMRNTGVRNDGSGAEINGIPRSISSVDPDLMLDEFKTNSLGPLLVSRALLPSLKKSASPRIINITSRVGSIADNGSGGSYGYRSSKTALNMITKSWSIDCPECPVVALHPGFIQTEMVGNRGDMSADECASKLKLVIDEFLKPDCGKYKSGKFLHRDGYELPW